jgi:hypothetical protein
MTVQPFLVEQLLDDAGLLSDESKEWAQLAHEVYTCKADDALATFPAEQILRLCEAVLAQRQTEVFYKPKQGDAIRLTSLMADKISYTENAEPQEDDWGGAFLGGMDFAQDAGTTAFTTFSRDKATDETRIVDQFTVAGEPIDNRLNPAAVCMMRNTLHLAAGKQLDEIGETMGRHRPQILSDSTYRGSLLIIFDEACRHGMAPDWLLSVAGRGVPTGDDVFATTRAAAWFRAEVRRCLGITGDEMVLDTPENRTTIESIAAECKRRFPTVDSLGTVDLRLGLVADEIKLNLSIADSPAVAMPATEFNRHSDGYLAPDWRTQIHPALRADCLDPKVRSVASRPWLPRGEPRWAHRCEKRGKTWTLPCALGIRLNNEAMRLDVTILMLLDALGIEADIPF